MAHIAVLGLGLIGGSFALALKQHPGSTVVGFDPDARVADWAHSKRAVDRLASSPSEAVREADTVVLAAPVRAIIELLSQVSVAARPRAVITDTGSTKQAIVAHAEKVLPPDVAFVGGHPLAGRLRSRVSEADAGLFVGATYCLTPTQHTPEWALDRATELVETIGAVTRFLDPAEHDAALAAVSHLPYFASAALVNAVADAPGWPEQGALAAGGFRAVSSLVDGSPRMWADIALTNGAPIQRQLDALISTLTTLRNAVAAGDPAAIDAFLKRANASHRTWLDTHDSPAAPSPPASSSRRRRFPFLHR
jgi:prephenate dehydrogenase